MKHNDTLKIEFTAIEIAASLNDLSKLLHLASLNQDAHIDTDGVLLLASKLANSIESNLRAERLGEVLEVDERE